MEFERARGRSHRPGQRDKSAAELEGQARPEMLDDARVRPELQSHRCETRSCVGIEREAVDPSHPPRARSRDRSASGGERQITPAGWCEGAGPIWMMQSELNR